MFQLVTIPSRESAEIISLRLKACTKPKKWFYLPLQHSASLFEGDFWKMCFQLRRRTLFANRHFFTSVEGEILPDNDGCILSYRISLPYVLLGLVAIWNILLIGMWLSVRLSDMIREGFHGLEMIFVLTMSASPWLFIYLVFKWEIRTYKAEFARILRS